MLKASKTVPIVLDIAANAYGFGSLKSSKYASDTAYVACNR